VLNSVPASRRLARRTVLLQALATLLAALVCLAFGRDAALGALAGGAAITLGSAFTALSTFAGGVSGAGAVFGRLLLGTAAKWIVAIAVLYLAIAVWKWPALPVLAGMASAASALLAAARLELRRA
jgi:F0F1-type ATP synthase assembly protein I